MKIIDIEIGDTIKIGEGISMVILNAQGNSARLAVEAPKQTTVQGKEDYLRGQNRKLNRLRLVK